MVTKDKFKKDFSLIGAAKSTVNAAVALTNKALDQVENLRNTMRQAAMFVEKIKQIRANVELLLMAPGEFADRIQDLITSTLDAFDFSSSDDAAKFSRSQLIEALAMAVMMDSTPPVPNQSASERRKQATNQAALVTLFQQTAAIDTATWRATAL